MNGLYRSTQHPSSTHRRRGPEAQYDSVFINSRWRPGLISQEEEELLDDLNRSVQVVYATNSGTLGSGTHRRVTVRTVGNLDPGQGLYLFAPFFRAGQADLIGVEHTRNPKIARVLLTNNTDQPREWELSLIHI